MRSKISVLNENQYNIPANFEELVDNTLSIVNHSKNVLINIVFVDEEEIINLNINFRGIPKATDVLSFEGGYTDPETGKFNLGDIVICIPFVEKQAQTLRNNLHDDINLMVIHGLLHLLGYDHDNEDSKTNMWKIQNDVLSKLNIKLKNIPE